MRSFFSAKRRWWKDAILKIKMRKKLPAFTLVATSLAVLTWILIAQSFAMMSSGAMDTAKTQRVTAQAVEAAKLDEAALRNIAYDEIDEKGPHGRRPIEGMDDGSWESSVTVAPEKTLSDGERTKVKMATIQIFRTGDTVSRFSLDVPLVSSDFNVKNDDEKHRISEKYDEKHKTVDTVINRKVIYDNIKNDTPSHRISMVWDEASQSIKTLVDGKEIDGGGQKGWPDWENARVLEPTQHEKHMNYGYFLMPDDGFFIYVPSSYTKTEMGTMYVIPHGKEIYSGECADWNGGSYRKNPACGLPVNKGFYAGYAFPVSKGTFAWYHGQGYGVFIPLKK